MLAKIVAFDLDDTLTASKQTITREMAEVVRELALRTGVAIISGGMESQMRAQVLDHVELPDEALARVHLLPTCGTRYVRFIEGQWREIYATTLSDAQVNAAFRSIEARAKELGVWEDNTWGEAIENRGSQITYSALGQRAPAKAKATWDPDGSKRARLARAIQADLPDLSVRSGGATSVDITLAGVDKAYGMRRLMEATGLSSDEVIFFGDRLDPDGNDYPVLSTGITCHSVRDWRDTARQVRALLRN